MTTNDKLTSEQMIEELMEMFAAASEEEQERMMLRAKAANQNALPTKT